MGFKFASKLFNVKNSAINIQAYGKMIITSCNKINTHHSISKCSPSIVIPVVLS